MTSTLKIQIVLMVLMMAHSVGWGFTVLYVDVKYGLETAKVGLYLGYITTLAGAGLIPYIHTFHKKGGERLE